MKNERWDTIEALFHAARELQGKDRASFLAKECGTDGAIRRKVEALLASHERAGSFLESGAAAIAISSLSVSIAAGTRFGPYEILAPIGAGGLGEVYKAHDARLRRDVAIKVLQQVVPDRAAWERFQREARAASALSHPNICTVYDVGEADGQPYLVMELLEGVTLSAHIGEKPLESAAVLAIGAQIADALEAAHAKGILHRDIKPANVMITGRRHAKVLDFGLARQTAIGENQDALTLDAISIVGTVTGTPPYLSPEVLRGERADARSDLWALGVVLYQMLTGRLPFTGATVYEMSSAILKEPAPPLPASVPAELRAIVERCLAKQPGERYQNAGEVRSALNAVHTRAAAADGISRRTWLRAAGAAAVLLPGAAGTLWWLWQKDSFVDPLADLPWEPLADFLGDVLAAAISPDGTLAVYASDRDGQIDVFVSEIETGVERNVTNGRADLQLSSSDRGVGFSGNGQRVYFRPDKLPRTAHWISIIGGEDQPIVEGGISLAWSPVDGRMVYHKSDSGDPIYIADHDGRNSKKIFQEKDGVHCHFPIWSLDGRFIYFVKGYLRTDEWDIWRIASDGTSAAGISEPVRITSQNTRISHPDWLDERTLIYSAVAEDSSGQWLYAIDVERRVPHAVSYRIAERQFLSVAVSARDRRRLIATVADPSATLWTFPVSDRFQTDPPLSEIEIMPFSAKKRSRAPRFAPVSPGYLLFLSSKGVRDGLWKLENGIFTELWPGGKGDLVAPPGISQDGRICFSCRKQGRFVLHVMDANGDNVRPLAESLDVQSAASWSADGKWVAVAANQVTGANQVGPTCVFKVPVGGGDPIQLSDDKSYDPLWSPKDIILYSKQPRARRTELKAVTPNGAPAHLPILSMIELNGVYVAFRFMPGGNALITLATGESRRQEFVWFDLEKEQKRTLAELNKGSGIRNFDVSADGKHIIFDRVQDNAEIVVMNLP